MLFSLILLIVLGVTAVSSEYSSGMIRTTFIVTPPHPGGCRQSPHRRASRCSDTRDRRSGDVPGKPGDLRGIWARNGQRH